jgi:hypothetical protein
LVTGVSNDYQRMQDKLSVVDFIGFAEELFVKNEKRVTLELYSQKLWPELDKGIDFKLPATKSVSGKEYIVERERENIYY